MKTSVLNALRILAENGVSLNPNNKEKRAKARQLLINGYQNYQDGYSKVAIELFSVAATISCDYWLPYALSAEVYAKMNDFDKSGRFALMAKQMAGGKKIDNLENLIVYNGLADRNFKDGALEALKQIATMVDDEINEIARLHLEYCDWDTRGLAKIKKRLESISKSSNDSLVLECVNTLLLAIENAYKTGNLYNEDFIVAGSILLPVFRPRFQDGFANYLSSIKEEHSSGTQMTA